MLIREWGNERICVWRSRPKDSPIFRAFICSWRLWMALIEMVPKLKSNFPFSHGWKPSSQVLPFWLFSVFRNILVHICWFSAATINETSDGRKPSHGHLKGFGNFLLLISRPAPFFHSPKKSKEHAFLSETSLRREIHVRHGKMKVRHWFLVLKIHKKPSLYLVISSRTSRSKKTHSIRRIEITWFWLLLSYYWLLIDQVMLSQKVFV